MMPDIMLVTVLLSGCIAIGGPVCLLLPGDRFKLRLIAAPPIGLGLLAIGATVLYRWGFAPRLSMLGLSAGGAALWVVFARPSRISMPTGTAAGLGAGIVAVILVCLLPAWTGGPEFSIFQGNVFDQVTFYLSGTVGFRSYDYASLLASPHNANADPALARALWLLDNRGAAAMVHATVAGLGDRNATLSGYAFVAVLQVNMFLAALFLFVNIFEASIRTASLLAAALAIGFFEQYVIDINAWSQLAAQPIYLLLLATVALAFEPDRFGRRPTAAATRLAVWFASLLGAVLYLYPEALAIYGVGAMAIVIPALSGRTAPAAKACGAVGLGIGACLALLLALLFWDGTVGYLYRQLSRHGLEQVDWWLYFQKYLFGRSEDYRLILLDPDSRWKQIANAWFSLPVESMAAAFGLYLLLPTDSWPPAFAVLWKLALYGFLTVLVVVPFRTALRMRNDESVGASFRMVVGCVVCCVVPLAILCTGAYWSAGKGLSMVSPLIFVLATIPLLARLTVANLARGASLAFVAAHLALGALRPILVTASAGHQLPGLPTAVSQVMGQKAGADWDQRDWVADLRKCGGVELRVKQRYLNQIVQRILTDFHVPWADASPRDGFNGFTGPFLPTGWESFECVASTDRIALRPGQTLIWLGGAHGIREYFEATSGRLDVGTNPDISSSGTYGIEATTAGKLQWTSQAALFEIPNNPAAPARALRLALWPMPLAADRIRITANGDTVYDGSIPSDEITLPMEKFAGRDPLAIELRTNAITHYPNDPRGLGVAIRTLETRK